MNRLALSIDVEDWFCVKNMSRIFPYEQWDESWIRIENGLNFLLQELEKRKIRATFFMLGWILEKRPEIIQKIHNAGHEIGSHGYNHQTLDTMGPSEIEQDIIQSLNVIKKIIPELKVTGYRAPSFSITNKTFFAINILRQHGFKYDSSVYPISHPDYGIPDFGQCPRYLGDLLEIPLNYVNVKGLKIPISGGGYFRLLPYWLYRRLLKMALRNQDVVLYFHPWEFDPEQPKIKMPMLKKIRHYLGLKRNRSKFMKLLDDFEFVTMQEMYPTQSRV